MSVGPRGGLIGKSVSKKPDGTQRESQEETKMWSDASKKQPLTAEGDRTKTDTGGWEEDSQARERTLVKELGKLSS